MLSPVSNKFSFAEGDEVDPIPTLQLEDTLICALVANAAKMNEIRNIFFIAEIFYAFVSTGS
ncbi:MAG: hypothetical protein Fur0028_08190 [Bacteroidales bacterium]